MRRVLCAAAALIGVTLAIPAVLWAHAELTRSTPSKNSRLDKAPREIRLWFSEAPEIRLTTVTVADSAGRAVPLVKPVPGDSKLAIVVPILGGLSAGRYIVKWSTVAADGHPSSGSFSFTVLGRAVPVAEPVESLARPVVATTPTAGDTPMEMAPEESGPYIVARLISFAALLALIGVVVFHKLILPRLADRGFHVAINSGLAMTGLVAAVTLVAVCGMKLLLQSAMMAEMTNTPILDWLTTTAWGQAWLLQCVVAAIAIGAFAAARSGQRIGWSLATLLVAILAFTPALGGHAAASPRFTTLAIADDALHVMGAGGWLGSLLCLVAIGVPTISKSTSATRLQDIADLVNAFSPVALRCAGLVVVTGLVSAWLRLGALSALWTSDYGHVLVNKLIGVAVIVGLGAYNWRRVRPSLGTDASTARLRKSATAELVVGLFIVAATAYLVALPTPVGL